MTAQKTLLDGVLEVVERGRGALVVFDLDDTLLSTANRQLRILREFAALIESRNTHAAGLLRAIAREQLRYAVTDTARDAGVAEELLKDLKSFWFKRFFKNTYLLEDDVVAGAPEFVFELVRRGGVAVYMTGRDESMRQGTEASLSKRGFPLPDGRATRLLLKPRFDSPDFEFKNEALQRIAELGLVAASFENEPAHANLFVERFPEARHFLLETKHSDKPIVAHPSVLRIRDFRR